jgi:hypothetical protein
LEKLQAERLQNGYNLYKFEPIHRHYATLQIGTKRMQDTFSVDLETKLMNIGCVNLSLLAGYSRVENRTEFTRQSNSRHDTFESGLGWIDLNSRPIPEIEAMYSKIDDRLIQQNPNRAQDVFRVGVAINIVQPNRILEKRLKKEREERIIYEQEFANEIESAKAELEKAIERANIIMDEAIRKAASEESEQERYWIFSHARTHVELEIEDFPGMEHLEEDYIDEATRSTRERTYNLSRE